VHAAARRTPDLGEGITAHSLDVSDRAAVDALAGELIDVSALVVAAGINIRERRLEQLTPEAWDELVAVNLTGPFNLIHAFLDQLRATRGDCVIIGSVSGPWPDVSGAAYQATKNGVLALARAAGFEHHREGVRFTTILPGVVDTPILDNRPEPPPPEVRAHLLQSEDVAAACLFVVTLPPRAHVPELTILPTRMQAVGKTNVASPEPPAE
jgi:NAD(P)-dependent dehydrogenase (short-subunit alcohol dehydrogenase family)